VSKVPFQRHDPDGIARQFATRVRAERLRRDWTQATLAERSGVSLPTVRRFERLGRTSLENLLRLCHALGRLDEFAALLEPPPASSLDELERRAGNKMPERRRGRR